MSYSLIMRLIAQQVQLHLMEMIKAKKSGAGHTMYKVCRRVLNGPIVKKDTYCLEVVGKELRGKGGRNAAGKEEGRGTMVFASGSMYEGRWLAGDMHGQGKYTDATGDVYEGGRVRGGQEAGPGQVQLRHRRLLQWQVRGQQEARDRHVHHGRRQGGGRSRSAASKRVTRWGRASAGVRTGRRPCVVQHGKRGAQIPLFEAAKRAERIGLPPPGGSAPACD